MLFITSDLVCLLCVLGFQTWQLSPVLTVWNHFRSLRMDATSLFAALEYISAREQWRTIGSIRTLRRGRLPLSPYPLIWQLEPPTSHGEDVKWRRRRFAGQLFVTLKFCQNFLAVWSDGQVHCNVCQTQLLSIRHDCHRIIQSFRFGLLCACCVFVSGQINSEDLSRLWDKFTIWSLFWELVLTSWCCKWSHSGLEVESHVLSFLLRSEHIDLCALSG